MAQAIVALGSNMGDRPANLREAADRLGAIGRRTGVSRVYETAPMYVEDQPPFLNAALRLDTALSPMALLRALKCVEQEVGRLKRERFGPREIDLDLIAYGRLEYRYWADGVEVLRLPHPRAGERRFVLQPLHDLDPELSLPGIGRVADLLEATSSQSSSVQVCEDAALSL